MTPAGAAPAGLDATLRALADPTRRGVVDLLRDGPRRAGDLALALGATPPAMSRHLRVLRRRGLVSERSHPDAARVRVYRLEPAPFAELGRWLAAVEALWSEQLESFAAHVQRREGQT